MLKGKIIKNISNDYVVLVNSTLINCKARGKFRMANLTPLVGDLVEIDEKNNYILNILKRTNELKRPNVANIDVALIITSLKKPDLSLTLLDKQIVSIMLAKIEPVICFTKLDLLTKEELKEFKSIYDYYNKIGIKTFDNVHLKDLIKYLSQKQVVLTGQTGAGKSSLINKLDSSLNLEVGEISEALGRGKHTTRHREFYKIKDFYVCDTPGFSSLDLKEYKKEDIKKCFKEFNDYKCEYQDCNHLKEDNCAVKQAVENGKIRNSRYQSYKEFIKEVD